MSQNVQGRVVARVRDQLVVHCGQISGRLYEGFDSTVVAYVFRGANRRKYFRTVRRGGLDCIKNEHAYRNIGNSCGVRKTFQQRAWSSRPGPRSIFSVFLFSFLRVRLPLIMASPTNNLFVWYAAPPSQIFDINIGKLFSWPPFTLMPRLPFFRVTVTYRNCVQQRQQNQKPYALVTFTDVNAMIGRLKA